VTGRANSITESGPDPTLVTAGYDNTARLWDVTDPSHPNALATLTGHRGPHAAFSPDGHTLATGSADNTARLWNIHSPTLTNEH
jgi:WD40 repeat protein